MVIVIASLVVENSNWSTNEGIACPRPIPQNRSFNIRRGLFFIHILLLPIFVFVIIVSNKILEKTFGLYNLEKVK